MRRSVSGSPPTSSASRPTIQNGEVATSTAVRPLGTVSSAHTTPPFPNPSSNTPSTASVGHGARARQPLAAQREDRNQQAAGHNPSDRGHEQRRDRFKGDADREICRAPDQAHGDPGPVCTCVIRDSGFGISGDSGFGTLGGGDAHRNSRITNRVESQNPKSRIPTVP